MSLPLQVSEVVDTYVRLVDESAPGLLEGLYLHGAVALGDFRPDRSDIDFLALVSARPGAAAVTTLAAVHQEMDRLHPRPYFDGVYLTRADLAAGPDRCPDVPGCLQATFDPRCRHGLCPVTWHELRDCGVTVRGAALETLALWTDDAALLD